MKNFFYYIRLAGIPYLILFLIFLQKIQHDTFKTFGVENFSFYNFIVFYADPLIFLLCGILLASLFIGFDKNYYLYLII